VLFGTFPRVMDPLYSEGAISLGNSTTSSIGANLAQDLVQSAAKTLYFLALDSTRINQSIIIIIAVSLR
jgi:hypothetical protein